MARTKMVDGVETPLTAAEETKRDTQEAEWDAGLLFKAIANKIVAVNDLRDIKQKLPIVSEGFEIDSGVAEVGEMATTLFEASGEPIEIITLTNAFTIASATTQNKHNLMTGQTVGIFGADQNEYNVAAIITVTGNKTFDYDIVGTPVSPATGVLIQYSVDSFPHIPTTNETDVVIDKAIYLQIFKDLRAYNQACVFRARTLKNVVLAAPDVETVNLININTGWPDTGI